MRTGTSRARRVRRWSLGVVCIGALPWACSSGASHGATNDAAVPPDASSDVSTDAPFDPDAWPPFDASMPDPCNGNPALCDRTYDAVSYAMSHAAFANASPPFACPTQRKPLRTQLDDGIRALGLEAHGAGALTLCLHDCSLGSVPIGGVLGDVRAFLDVNPREVVTLLVEGGVAATDLASAIAAAHLDTYAVAHAAGSPWPTLRAMIAQGERLVVFADVTGTSPAWMLPLKTYVSATSTTFTSANAMTCDATSGTAGAPLYLVNELLVDGESGSEECAEPPLADQVNGEPFFLNRTMACAAQRGSHPTFVAVDFYDDGDVLGVVRALNAADGGDP